jgi:uncharacterized protein
MIGVNSTTGKALKGYDHLRQSIRDILKTPIGSRVMRRDYGSRIWDLVDAPINAETLAELHIATAEALDKWEPRILIESVAVTFDPAGVRVSSDYPVLTTERVSAEIVMGNNENLALYADSPETNFWDDVIISTFGYLQEGSVFRANNLYPFMGEMTERGYMRADIQEDNDVDISDVMDFLRAYVNLEDEETTARFNRVREIAFNRWKAGDPIFNKYWASAAGRATSAALIVDVAGTYLPDGKKINLEGLVV